MKLKLLIVFLVAGVIAAKLMQEEEIPPIEVYLELTRSAPPATQPSVAKKPKATKEPRASNVRRIVLKPSDPRAAAIDRFFTEREAPLAGYGATFVRAADAYELDWRLLPAIAWKESLGGLSRVARRYNNPFGVGDPNFWHFGSYEHAIRRTAQMMGGDSRYYYENMKPSKILRTFNTVEWAYPQRVMRIMTEVHKS